MTVDLKLGHRGPWEAKRGVEMRYLDDKLVNQENKSRLITINKLE